MPYQTRLTNMSLQGNVNSGVVASERRISGRVRIPPEVARKIGFYVYLYIDPRNDQPFYVGKGQGSRAVSHLSVVDPSRKALILRQLREAGLSPRIDILAHGLPDEETAFRIEAAVIDALGLEQLTNEARGWQSVQQGRMLLRELIVYYAAKPVRVRDPVILIRINRLYRHGMDVRALYEATRGVWRVNATRAQGAKYAFAVFEGVVREVFRIEQWHRAGSTPYATRRDVQVPGRWEFTGTIASQPDLPPVVVPSPM